MLEVRAVSYRNSGGRGSNGFCCDALFDTSCDSLPGYPCDNEFVFCLRNIGTAEDGTTANCPLGRYSTDVIGGDDFSFATPIDSGVPNPMTFTGNIWPVREFNVCYCSGFKVYNIIL